MFGVNVTVNSKQYKLQMLGYWGGPWNRAPYSMDANTSATFVLNDNDRGGIWWRAIDPVTQNEIGLVTMSFTCPKMSDNSAEGSPTSGYFLSAGLQTYSGGGHPLNISYNVGTSNLACWSSGSSNNGKIECSQTSMSDTRVWVSIQNPNAYSLKFGAYWNDNSNGASNWYWAPSEIDVPPPGGKRTIALKDNDRAGIFLKVFDQNNLNELGFSNMLFTCPKMSSNSAEGSPSGSQFFVPAGLQKYAASGTPANFIYQIGNPNKACWNNGNSNDGNIVCDQTTFKNARAWIIANNTMPVPVTFISYWNDNTSGASNWYITPVADDSIPANCTRYFVLLDNDRAGIYYNSGGMDFHLSFTCPKMSSNSAEGSLYTGLQSYSEHGTPVTFTYNIGTPNLACWASGTYNDGKIVCSQTNVSYVLDQWMKKVKSAKPGFGDQSLFNVLLPGTHDAACYSMQNALLSPWTQTQDSSSNFGVQLNMGVRYFDLRLDYVNGTHTFHHGGYDTNQTINDLISALYAFYANNWTAHQNEVVVLDFTHFQNYTTAAYQDLITIIATSTISNYLLPRGSSNPTLSSIWGASSARIITSVDFDPSSYSNSGNIWNGNNIFAPGWSGSAFWANTSSPDTLTTFLNGIVNNAPYASRLWVLQDILTPAGLSGITIAQLAPQANALMFGTPGIPWKTKANIVIQDYFDIRLTVEAMFVNNSRS